MYDVYPKNLDDDFVKDIKPAAPGGVHGDKSATTTGFTGNRLPLVVIYNLLLGKSIYFIFFKDL